MFETLIVLAGVPTVGTLLAQAPADLVTPGVGATLFSILLAMWFAIDKRTRKVSDSLVLAANEERARCEQRVDSLAARVETLERYIAKHLFGGEDE